MMWRDDEIKLAEVVSVTKGVAESKIFFQWIDVIHELRRLKPVRFSPHADLLDYATEHLSETYGTRT